MCNCAGSSVFIRVGSPGVPGGPGVVLWDVVSLVEIDAGGGERGIVDSFHVAEPAKRGETYRYGPGGYGRIEGVGYDDRPMVWWVDYESFRRACPVHHTEYIPGGRTLRVRNGMFMSTPLPGTGFEVNYIYREVGCGRRRCRRTVRARAVRR